MENFVVWTKVREQDNYDLRDYKIEAVLSNPTEYEINAIPAEFSWMNNIWHTYYQNGRGSCVSLWGTHSMQIQNIDEILKVIPQEAKEIYWRLSKGDNIINLSWESLWKAMWHDLEDKNDSWDYVENMLNALRKKGILGKDMKWTDKTYLAGWDAYRNAYASEASIRLLKYDMTKYPLVMVIRWNSTTWNEMMSWRLSTVLEMKDCTGGHCVTGVWYSASDLIVSNSRRANDENWYICSFKIDWATYKQMIKTGMINWRYWQTFDKKDAIVDLERYNRKMQAMETLRQAKKMYEKGDMEDKKFFDKIWLGKYLKNKYKFTDSEL